MKSFPNDYGARTNASWMAGGKVRECGQGRSGPPMPMALTRLMRCPQREIAISEQVADRPDADLVGQ